MDERKDPEPGDGSHPRRPLAAAVALSPIQQAWSRYVRHATACACCQDIDQGRCEDAELLYRAWRDHSDLAYRRLDGETA